MRRLQQAAVTSTLILSIMSAGMSPCMAMFVAAPVSAHDCCPPEELDAMNDPAPPPMVAGGMADCCLVAPQPVAPASIPVVTPPSSEHHATVALDSFAGAPAASTTHARPIDARARSAPRSQLVTVLLI